MTRILVISDTHLNSFDQLPKAIIIEAEKSDMIVHAGDFCSLDVLQGLRNIKNVIAVQGNMDEPDLKDMLPRTESFDLDGVQFGLIHGYGSPNSVVDNIKDIFSDVEVLIFGHSHIPYSEELAGKLLFNPGSSTDPRSAVIPSYGIITVENGELKSQIFRLEEE